MNPAHTTSDRAHQATAYRCRRCRTTVAESKAVVEHEPASSGPASGPAPGSSARHRKSVSTRSAKKRDGQHWGGGGTVLGNSVVTTAYPMASHDTAIDRNTRSGAESPPPCHHIFVDPDLTALRENALEGRLECPQERCRAKLGSFAWAGMACSCGRWIAPAFAIHRSRVDEVAMESAVPLTSASALST